MAMKSLGVRGFSGAEANGFHQDDPPAGSGLAPEYCGAAKPAAWFALGVLVDWHPESETSRPASRATKWRVASGEGPGARG